MFCASTLPFCILSLFCSSSLLSSVSILSFCPDVVEPGSGVIGLHLMEISGINPHAAIDFHFNGFPILHEKGAAGTVLNVGAGQITELPTSTYQILADTFVAGMMVKRKSLECLNWLRSAEF